MPEKSTKKDDANEAQTEDRYSEDVKKTDQDKDKGLLGEHKPPIIIDNADSLLVETRLPLTVPDTRILTAQQYEERRPNHNRVGRVRVIQLMTDDDHPDAQGKCLIEIWIRPKGMPSAPERRITISNNENRILRFESPGALTLESTDLDSERPYKYKYKEAGFERGFLMSRLKITLRGGDVVFDKRETGNHELDELKIWLWFRPR